MTPLSAKYRTWSLICLLLPLVAAWIILLLANLDARDGRAMLFMDEAIFFDNTKAILSAETPSSLWRAWLVGPEHRYGQIGFMTTAVIGWLPWLVAGDAGLILAIRMTCATALLTAYGLLGWCLLRLRPGSALPGVALVAMCITLPSTVYYGTMPKPEPFQLLLLAGYLVLSVRRGVVLGPHALLLGGVFGAKISGLPVVMGFFVLGVFQLWSAECGERQQWVRRAAIAVCWIVLGAVLCEPAIVCDTRAYVTWTFGMTTHGADNVATGPRAWIDLLSGGLLPFHQGFWWLACAVAACALGFGIWNVAQRGWRDALTDPRITLGVGVLVCGLGSLGLIMIAVHRLWEFYLHLGFVMTLMGILLLGSITAGGRAPIWDRALRPVGLGIFGVTVALWCWIGIPRALAKADALCKRSQQPEFAAQRAAYGTIISVTKEVSARLGRRIVAIIDPELWDAGKQPWMDRWQAWGPDWDGVGDIKIMTTTRNPFATPTPGNVAYLTALTTTGNDPYELWQPEGVPAGMLILIRRSLQAQIAGHSIPTALPP